MFRLPLALALFLSTGSSALATDVTVRLEGKELSAAQVAVTYVATRNLWWIGCQNHNPFFAGSPYATQSATYDLHGENGALAAIIPSYVGGFCGYGAPDGMAVALSFHVNGLSTNTQVLILPAPVPGVTGSEETAIRCELAGDSVSGPFYKCQHPTYGFENGAISLRLETL